MARQVVVIPGLRVKALRASGVFPRSWGIAMPPASDDGLPNLVDATELRERLNSNDGAWLGQHFQSRAGAVLATWVGFVDQAGGEHGALHEVRTLQRRLSDRLASALGYRTDELSHLTVLVDDEADQGVDDDRRLVPRVRHAWKELRMPGPLFYLGPRLNSVEDVPLAASGAWPASVGTLILALHVSTRPDAVLPRDGIHVWRGVAWRPWSTEEATRMRRELGRLTTELLDPGRGLTDKRDEERLRVELGREGGLEVPPPTSPGKGGDPADSSASGAHGAIRRFDGTGDTKEYGEQIRSRRQAAAAEDHERQHFLWTLGWNVAEDRPLGARRARQILEEVPVTGADSEESATETASRYSDLCAAAERLIAHRGQIQRCADHIGLAERGRAGPAARLGVAVAVVSLLAYAIWFLAEGVLGLTGMATGLLVSVSAGAVGAALALTVLEAKALKHATRDFSERLVPGLYSSRSQLVHQRGQLMGASSQQRFRNHDRSTRAALHGQLNRLGQLVDSALGLTRDEDFSTEGTFTAPEPRVTRCFLPHLYDKLPALSDQGSFEDPVRRSLDKTAERWERFISDHDPHGHGNIPATPLVEELSEETTRLRMDAFRQQVSRLGAELPAKLIEQSERVSLQPFISGLSHRQEGKRDQPLQWASLTDVPDLQKNWDVEESSANRLRALGYVGLRLDHLPLAGRFDDQDPRVAR